MSFSWPWHSKQHRYSVSAATPTSATAGSDCSSMSYCHVKAFGNNLRETNQVSQLKNTRLMFALKRANGIKHTAVKPKE